MPRSFLGVLYVLLVVSWSAGASDRSGEVPATPAAPLLADANDAEPCSFAAVGTTITLADAVNRTLCANPKARGAWQRIKVYAAGVRVARDSYWPIAGIKAAETESRTRTLVTDEHALDTSANDLYPAASLSLNWVLYDFGLRANQLESARDLLAAARANLDLTLQQVFLQAAGDFYDAQAAQASTAAAEEIERLTQKSVEAAHMRVEKGVAPLSDELQAQTAYASAVVTRVRAAAELRAKLGALAGDMGVEPDRGFTVPAADTNETAAPGFTEAVHDLIEMAKRTHPSVTAAERSLAAAIADEKAARAHGRPTIELVGGLSRSNESLTPSLGSPTVPGSVSNKTVGIQIDVPISDALWKRGQIAEAHAQVEVQQDALQGAEQQVAQDVWKSYVELQADTDNLENSRILLESARNSLAATKHRYDGGVGNILELLGSQTAYANALQQRIRAFSDWRYARMALGASLGKLGLWAVE
jgi:outer membrane protein